MSRNQPEGVAATIPATNVCTELCLGNAARGRSLTVHSDAVLVDEVQSPAHGYASVITPSQVAGSSGTGSVSDRADVAHAQKAGDTLSSRSTGSVRIPADAAHATSAREMDVETLLDLLDLEACGLPVVWPTGWDRLRARSVLENRSDW